MSAAALIARAQALAGGARCRRILGDADEVAWIDFAQWFLPVWHGQMADGLLTEAARGWCLALDEPRAASWLRDVAGIDLRLLARGLVGVGRAGEWFAASTAEGLLWQPAGWRAGTPVVLLPVCDAGLTTASVEAEAECLDLLALDPADPARWARRTAYACILGPHPGFQARLPWPKRIRLCETPLGWLRGGAAAGSYCILEWDCFETETLARLIDDGQVAVVCDDEAHAARLRARLRPRRPKLTLEVAA